ncbi:MAG: glutathione S-transferase family protein [Bacteriovoracaceae bacterium]|nr:glutathione S-transferase family protein [Bacteriovoracaceae bacterium]
MSDSLKLVIGNKRFSSWSLRPWLILKFFQIPFEEKLILLDQPDTLKNILAYSPTGKVPALIEGDVNGNFVVWDSLAIAEYLNEKFPEKSLWPKNFQARAHARSISNEMHSGFSAMRERLSHDVQKEVKNFDVGNAKSDIDRIKFIWTDCLQKYGGPFLFGNFCIADAMYAPVVNRFVSYDVPVSGEVQKYVENMRSLKELNEWIVAGKAETYLAPYHTL